VVAIQATHTVVELVTDGVFGDAIERAADQVSEGMATENITAEKHHVDRENQGAYAHAEPIGKPERLPGILDEECPDQIREPQKIAVEILHDKGETLLAEIRLAGLADGAGGRIGPKGFIVGPAVVIASEAEEARDPKNQQRGGEWQEGWIPGWLRAEPGVRRIAEDLGGIERRYVGTEGIIPVLPGGPIGVNQKSAESEKDQ
jgi:hypothetical protein